MSTTPEDGPLRAQLKRWSDRPARLWLQRWKPDHPVTISLTLEEIDWLERALPAARQQIALQPHSAGVGSTLDLLAMLGGPAKPKAVTATGTGGRAAL